MHDYVIVGAGSAGCALAARLTEDPAVRVLLADHSPRSSMNASSALSFGLKPSKLGVPEFLATDL